MRAVQRQPPSCSRTDLCAISGANARRCSTVEGCVSVTQCSWGLSSLATPALLSVRTIARMPNGCKIPHHFCGAQAFRESQLATGMVV